MTKILSKCGECDGTGRLAALGYDGLADDAFERRDVKRRFDRLCGHCFGTGRCINDIKIEETKPS